MCVRIRQIVRILMDRHACLSEVGLTASTKDSSSTSTYCDAETNISKYDGPGLRSPLRDYNG